MVIIRGNNSLPVDRGWAWAIAAAGFLANVLMGASGQTNNVLFVEILQKYDASITTGSLLFMCHTIAYGFSSVITTTFILPKLDERKCVILGGLLCSVVSLSASFAPNIGAFVAIVSMKGYCHGLILIPVLSLIPKYFDKYRSRASIIPWCGGGIASIIGPFIIRTIRKEFGVSGTYFLLAAVELHICVAGLLLRPVSAYRINSDAVDNSQKNKTIETNLGGATAAPETINSIHDEPLHEEENISQLEDANHHVVTDDADDVKESLMTLAYSKDRTDPAAEMKILTKLLELPDPTIDRDVFKHRERRNTYFGSIMTLDSEIGAPLEMMVQDITDSPAEKGMTKWQKMYQDASLELWSFRWAMLAVLPGTVNIYITSYMPTISNAQGASLDQAALLATIMGSVDLVSRVCFGFIADSDILLPSQLLAISQICMGIGCHFFRLGTSFTSLVPMIIFLGMFVGSRGPFISLMCIEVVGVKKMAQAYSIISTMATLTGASFNPILGAVVEATGSFIPVMHVIGTGYILCAILLLLLPLFSRLDIKHGRKQ